jgi:ribosomal protein L11 methyltransferase
MNYIAYHFQLKPKEKFTDILLAELSLFNFESFEETEKGLSAYIQEHLDEEDLVSQINLFQNEAVNINYQREKIETKNWNEEWEKNFSPILVGSKCMVRAPFHEKIKVDYDVIIEPKMSFGTGHHATTFQMIELILEEKWNTKKVLDMGCGSGVLGILASMMGAKQVTYIDIDDWCVENTNENTERNKVKGEVILGGAEKINTNFDVILANINRNILLKDLAKYAAHLNENGQVYLSGFYKKDLNMIKDEADKQHLTFVKNLEKENWIAAKFVKSKH